MFTCSHLNKVINQRYGIDLIGHSLDAEHLLMIYENYSYKMSINSPKYIGESSDVYSEEYTKAFLISEAARMLLREIAPKRTKKRKGS